MVSFDCLNKLIYLAVDAFGGKCWSEHVFKPPEKSLREAYY